MDDSLNAEREMERLSGMRDRVERLREQLQRLKEKESDVAVADSREEAIPLRKAPGRIREDSKK
jgi:hypothetical protein